MTQVAGMNTAPSSRIPMAKSRQPNVYQNGYDQHQAIPAPPSKLEQMQMQYQQKLIRDKEKRMGEINQHTDERAKRFGENGTNNSIVKDFFKERREMAEQGYVPNIDQHFSRKKAEASGSGYSMQYQQKKQFGYSGRPPPHKNSAGRDKSNLLAPIDHGAKGQKSRKSSAASNGSYPSSYQMKPLNGARSLPASRKTSFVASGATTPTGYQSNGEGNGDVYSDRRGKQYGDAYDDENRAAVLSSRNVAAQNKKISFKDWQQKQKKASQIPTSTDNHHRFTETQDSPERPSDFQKWQAEQDAQRSERLQKHAKANGVTNGYNQSPVASSRNSKRNSPPSKNGGSSPGMVRQQKQALLQKRINTQSKKQLYASNSTNISYQDSEEEDGEGESGAVDENLAKKQKELEAMIRQQQAELKKMKHQRAAEDEENRKAREHEARRVAQQQARQRRLQEAEEKEEREREEQERREREKRELDERDRQWLVEQGRAEAQTKSQQAPAHNQDTHTSKKSNRHDSQNAYSDPYREEIQDDSPQPFIPKKPTRARSNRAKRAAPPPQPREPTPEPEYYPPEPVGYNLDDADDGTYQKVDVAPCKVCGRKFAKDRLAKHMKACKVSNKPRKVFNVAKMRTDGTDLAQYSKESNRRPEPPKKKSNWKKQHENFIATIRYAKQVTDAENAGTSLANLPPPPVTEEPDLVPCPTCNRTFNVSAAERHIPRCRDIKTRPAPARARRK